MCGIVCGVVCGIVCGGVCGGAALTWLRSARMCSPPLMTLEACVRIHCPRSILSSFRESQSAASCTTQTDAKHAAVANARPRCRVGRNVKRARRGAARNQRAPRAQSRGHACTRRLSGAWECSCAAHAPRQESRRECRRVSRRESRQKSRQECLPKGGANGVRGAGGRRQAEARSGNGAQARSSHRHGSRRRHHSHACKARRGVVERLGRLLTMPGMTRPRLRRGNTELLEADELLLERLLRELHQRQVVPRRWRDCQLYLR